MTGAAVPKAPVDKNRDLLPRKRDVSAPPAIELQGLLDPESKTPSMKLGP